MADEREYQPQLLYAKITDWIRKQVDENFRMDKVRLLIFRNDIPGAWILSKGKLYWDENLSDEYFVKCDQDELLKLKDKIGECVITDFPKLNESYIIGKNFDEMIQRLL